MRSTSMLASFASRGSLFTTPEFIQRKIKGAQTMTIMHRILGRSIPGIAGFILLATAPFASAQFYLQENLVSDLASPPGGAPKIVDSNLVNPWGVAYGPTGPFSVANQGTATATLYNVHGTSGAVSKIGLVVPIPRSSVY